MALCVTNAIRDSYDIRFAKTSESLNPWIWVLSPSEWPGGRASFNTRLRSLLRAEVRGSDPVLPGAECRWELRRCPAPWPALRQSTQDPGWDKLSTRKTPEGSVCLGREGLVQALACPPGSKTQHHSPTSRGQKLWIHSSSSTKDSPLGTEEPQLCRRRGREDRGAKEPLA